MVHGTRMWIAVFFITVARCEAAEVRTWTDKTGKHTIQAELVRVAGGNATLRREDGKTVTVPVDKFCVEDQAILEEAKPLRRVGGIAVNRPNSGDSISSSDGKRADFGKTYRELLATARVQRDAAFVLTLYLAFIETPGIDEEEKQKARGDIPEWREKADAQKIRVGNKWMTAEERQAAREAEIRLIKEAHRLIDIKNDELARDKFLEASKVNPEAVRADFYLGLLNALVAHHHYDGDEHFRECIARLQRDDDILYGARSANLVAALNNRAILQVRKRQYTTAIGLWRRALEIAPMTPELVQNLGLMVELANTAEYVRIPKELRNSAGNLYSKYTVENSLARFDKNIGWLFIPYVDTADGTSDSEGDDEFVNVAWCTGFCVGGEYLLTSRYPLIDCDRVVAREGGHTFATAEGKVAAVSDDSHLALVRIAGLKGKPLPLNLVKPKPAQDVTIVGYGAPGLMSHTLQHRVATILDPPHFYENVELVVRQNVGPGVDVFTRSFGFKQLLMHDALTSAAMEGAPLLDKNGAVVGVHLGNRPQFGKFGSKNSWAESGEDVINRLRGAVQDINFRASSSDHAEPLEESAIESLVAGSIYQLSAQKRAPRLAWSHRIEESHRLQQQGGWTSYEDRTCMACNGKLQMRCIDCTRGVVKRNERELKHKDPNTGFEIWGNKTTKHACRTCGGRGVVKCTNCNGEGVDKIFSE